MLLPAVDRVRGGVPLKFVAMLALAGLIATLPLGLAGPADECLDPNVVCRRVEVSHQNLPVLNTLPYFDTYYLIVPVKYCQTNVVSSACTGHPIEPGSGVPLPTNPPSAVGVRVFGVLYQETNGAEGLQRSAVVFNGVNLRPDKAVLV